MHSESPSVYHLPVHLENQQLVYYNADDDVDEVLGGENLKKTPLTEWFKANKTYPEARNTAYQDFPKKWVYVKQAKKWKPRERGPSAIGRMYFASPAQGERFYLRMLLTTVTSATSFANLWTVNNIQYGTFREACHALVICIISCSSVIVIVVLVCSSGSNCFCPALVLWAVFHSRVPLSQLMIGIVHLSQGNNLFFPNPVTINCSFLVCSCISMFISK